MAKRKAKKPKKRKAVTISPKLKHDCVHMLQLIYIDNVIHCGFSSEDALRMIMDEFSDYLDDCVEQGSITTEQQSEIYFLAVLTTINDSWLDQIQQKIADILRKDSILKRGRK